MNMMNALLISKVPIETPEIFFREQCWILKGKKFKNRYVGTLSYQGEGDMASVDFDWRKATSTNVLGFYHTHPSGLQTPSTRDDRTMGALVRAEGRPLLCGILTEESDNCYVYKRLEDGTIGAIQLRNIRIIGRKFFTATVED